MANQHFQIVIIGAGPAGMAAALTTTKAGLETIVIDDQKDSGGQVYQICGPIRKHHPSTLVRAIMMAIGSPKALPIVAPYTVPIARFGKSPIRMKLRLSRGAKPN